MFFIPVSYSNAMIVSAISATATDVRTSEEVPFLAVCAEGRGMEFE